MTSKIRPTQPIQFKIKITNKQNPMAWLTVFLENTCSFFSHRATSEKLPPLHREETITLKNLYYTIAVYTNNSLEFRPSFLKAIRSQLIWVYTVLKKEYTILKTSYAYIVGIRLSKVILEKFP